jgi:hypothetical protein
VLAAEFEPAIPASSSHRPTRYTARRLGSDFVTIPRVPSIEALHIRMYEPGRRQQFQTVVYILVDNTNCVC